MKQNNPSFLSFAVNALVRRSLFNPLELPNPPSSYAPLKEAGLEVIPLTASDHISAVSWYKAPQEGKHTFLYFHGNTDNMGAYYRVDKYAEILESGHGLLALGYRGFDIPFDGTITEQGLYRDARAAIDFLAQEQHIPIENMILFGESLGSGVAIQMAQEYQNFAGMILDCPYPSIPYEIKHRHPYVPDFLLNLVEDQFNSVEKIPDITIPKLIIHAGNDTVVPFPHGEILFNAALEPKKFQKVDAPGTSHVEYPREIFLSAVTTFAANMAHPTIKTDELSNSSHSISSTPAMTLPHHHTNTVPPFSHSERIMHHPNNSGKIFSRL